MAGHTSNFPHLEHLGVGTPMSLGLHEEPFAASGLTGLGMGVRSQMHPLEVQGLDSTMEAPSEQQVGFSSFRPSNEMHNPRPLSELFGLKAPLEPENPRSRKGPRKAILVGVKKSICEHADANPSWTLEQLADWATMTLGIPMKKRSIFDILTDKEKWLAADPGAAGSKRLREAAYPELERRLGAHLTGMKNQGESIKTEDLRARALELAQEMGIPTFTASNGWIHRFLKRQNMMRAVPPSEGMNPLLGNLGTACDPVEMTGNAQGHVEQVGFTQPVGTQLEGDAAGAIVARPKAKRGRKPKNFNREVEEAKGTKFRDQLQRSIMVADGSKQGLSKARDQVRQAIRLLRLGRKDVFNLGEAVLFFAAHPVRSSSAAEGGGSYSSGQRVRLTLGLCCNASGTERLKPILIADAQRPRCFGESFNPSLFVHYFWDSAASMTAPIFNDWLLRLDTEMKQAGRPIAVLLDAAPYHSVTLRGALHTEVAGLRAVQLTAVTLIYLPTCTADGAVLQSVGQPLDQGVITMFKVKYRKQLMQWVVSRHESNTLLEASAPDVGIPDSSIHCIRPSLRDALVWCAGIWQTMDACFIASCWVGSGAFPPLESSYGAGRNQSPLDAISTEMTGLQQLIDRFGLQDAALDPVAYLNMQGEEEDFAKLMGPGAASGAGDAPGDPSGEPSAPASVSIFAAERFLEELGHFGEENPSVLPPAVVLELQQIRTVVQREILRLSSNIQALRGAGWNPHTVQDTGCMNRDFNC